MKTIIVTLILVLMLPSLYCQSRKDIEKEWALYKNNKVKAKLLNYNENCYQKSYYDSDGKPTLLEIFEVKGGKTNEITYYYDLQNNLIKEINNPLKDKDAYSSEELTNTHEYDITGNRIRTWMIEFNIEYIYDSNGLLLESNENGLGESSKLKYRYNDKNQLKVIRIENSDGTKEIREHVYYDSDNIIDTRFHHATSDWKAKDVYIVENRTYYDNGLLKNVMSNKKIIEEYTYEFYE
ncbi:MAG: hypothetical protein K8I03_01225 [Ignavibacteria bacterium]|nr:hypothetical protein [Ignavibacteria bacterium]